MTNTTKAVIGKLAYEVLPPGDTHVNAANPQPVYPYATLVDCVLLNNLAGIGAGACECDLQRCLMTGNVAAGVRTGWGGGAAGGSLINCVVAGNRAAMGGGGVLNARLDHCTVVGNEASGGVLGVGRGGGVWGGRVRNSIVYFNGAPGNAAEANCSTNAEVESSCTMPLPAAGAGNVSSDPLFNDRAAADFHLLRGSPAIDVGRPSSSPIADDFDGLPRPLDGLGRGVPVPDLGAFE